MSVLAWKALVCLVFSRGSEAEGTTFAMVQYANMLVTQMYVNKVDYST